MDSKLNREISFHKLELELVEYECDRKASKAVFLDEEMQFLIHTENLNDTKMITIPYNCVESFKSLKGEPAIHILVVPSVLDRFASVFENWSDLLREFKDYSKININLHTQDLSEEDEIFLETIDRKVANFLQESVQELNSTIPSDQSQAHLIPMDHESVPSNTNGKKRDAFNDEFDSLTKNEHIPKKRRKKISENGNEELPKRELRSRNNIRKTNDLGSIDDDGEFEQQMQKALEESRKGTKLSDIRNVQPKDRFPEFNNETVLLNYKNVIITMEDYKCLDYRELLLDVVLDFYLKYIWEEVLPQDLRQKVFVYNSQMYNDLAINSNYSGWNADENRDIPAAQKRYERVKPYHEGVNIFEKDFLVIPCFDCGHWFLAIVCFPYLNGCVNSLGEKLEFSNCMHDKTKTKEEKENPVKTSSIIVLDSVSSNPSRRNNAILHIKNMLMSEYHAKYEGKFELDKHFIKGAAAKCPQQSNATDCGLFLLEFMEQFLVHNPLQDYRFPPDLSEWFKSDIVYAKREKIATVMRKKMIEQGNEIPLPNIILYKEHDVVDDEISFSNSIIKTEEQVKMVMNNDENGNNNMNNNNGNIEDANNNSNNNEEAFNNNNDFYEANHNVVDVVIHSSSVNQSDENDNSSVTSEVVEVIDSGKNQEEVTIVENLIDEENLSNEIKPEEN